MCFLNTTRATLLQNIKYVTKTHFFSGKIHGCVLANKNLGLNFISGLDELARTDVGQKK
jgi:hypothetical protein